MSELLHALLYLASFGFGALCMFIARKGIECQLRDQLDAYERREKHYLAASAQKHGVVTRPTTKPIDSDLK